MAGEYQQGRLLSQLQQLNERLNPAEGTPLWDPKSTKAWKKQKEYMDIYNQLKGMGADLSGYGYYNLNEGANAYVPPGTTAVGTPPTPGETPDATSPPADTPPPAQPDKVTDVTSDPFGPDYNDILATIKAGLPAGINLNNPDAAKMLEALYPLVRDAYNQQMTQEAIGTAAKSVDEYKNDPLFQKLIAGMTDKLANPFTFDDKTVSLMRNQASDTLANQEAAMGERLRSLGATQGISPDSPLYASMAAQASLARDLGQQQMERDLQIQKAMQDQQDWYKAYSAGGQLAGAYQTGLGQRYSGLAGAQLGGKYQDLGNPFEGLWSGLLMQDQLNQGDSTWEKLQPFLETTFAGMSGLGDLSQLWKS